MKLSNVFIGVVKKYDHSQKSFAQIVVMTRLNGYPSKYPEISHVCTKVFYIICKLNTSVLIYRFLWGKDSGFRLGYAINAVGCMGIYWQLVLRNCIIYQKARQSKHKLVIT